MAMPQCCYLAKGAKRPSHTTNMQTFSNKSSFYILAVTTLKASNLNSAVWDRIFIFCCMNRPQLGSKASMILSNNLPKEHSQKFHVLAPYIELDSTFSKQPASLPDDENLQGHNTRIIHYLIEIFKSMKN